MNPYEIAIKWGHRMLYGYLHHSQMAAFYDLMKMPITADNQRKNAIEDAKKRAKIDEYIVNTFEKMPLYTASNIETISRELMGATLDSIKNNKPEWLKKSVEVLIRYEKDTIALLEMLVKEAEQANDSKLAEWIKKSIKDVKDEISVIEHFQGELQKHGYDYDKFKNEKGDSDMPRYEYDDRRRRRMEMDDDWFIPFMDDDRRYMDDDRYYEPMGFADRHYPHEREYPYEMDDARRRRYRRRYR